MKHIPIQKHAGKPVELVHNNGRIAQRTIIAFTDASIRKSGSGVGVATRCSDDGYASKTTLRAKHTARDINELEMGAIFLALETSDQAADIVVYTDSQTAIHQVTGATSTKKYERLTQLILRAGRSRKGATSVCKVKAHSGNEGNELADALAAEGTQSAYAFELPRDGDDLDIWRARHVGEEHVLCVVEKDRPATSRIFSDQT
jgi:ribonuclease HI